MKKQILAPLLFAAVFVLQGFILVMPASAQQAGNGYLGRGKDQYRIFSFGDALAGGLWAGMARITKGNRRISLNGRYREGSGLARSAVYNWPARLAAVLEKRRIDIALVQVGSNDARSIRKPGELLVFDSPEWKQAYTMSVRAMMAQFKRVGVKVYWVQVPPVANPLLDEKLKIINRIQETEAANAGFRYIKIREVFTTAKGAFTFKGAGLYGNVVRLRARSGVRFLKDGNDKLASIVLAVLEKDMEIADGERPVTDAPNPSGAKVADSARNTPYSGPIFSMQLADGSSLVVQPKNAPPVNALRIATVGPQSPVFSSGSGRKLIAAGISGDKAIARLKETSKPDSAAKMLFNDGVWPENQPGRLGDFSINPR